MHRGRGHQGQLHSQILAQGTVHAFVLTFAPSNIKVALKSKVLCICECDGPVLMNRVTLKVEILLSQS